MQQIRITRTSELDNVLSSLKERYPLLSEAEIVKMALSRQYYQETRQEIPNARTRAILKQADEDLKAGNTSPKFKTAKEFVEYLRKQRA